MEHIGQFMYLNMEIKERKNAKELKEDERHYAIVKFLDSNSNPCQFFVFKKEVIQKLCELNLTSKQEVAVTYEIVCNNGNWNVRLVDVNE